MVTLHVPGPPVPQPRHRTTRTGRHYLPSRHPVNQFKLTVQAAARAAGVKAIDGAVDVAILAVFARPQSHVGRGGALRVSAPDYPGHGSGDWDNLAKAVCDALTGIAWADDTQIVSGAAAKRYAQRGEQPHTLVTIREA